MPANLENSAVATGLEKGSFHSNLKEGNAKEGSNYRTVTLISHTRKLMLKILQGRLQQYMNRELPDVQAGFRKGKGTRGKTCQHPLDHGKRKRVPENHLFLVAQTVKCLSIMQETWVPSLSQEDPLEKEMATHSSILAWRIPWTEEPGRLQSMGSQRFRHS